LVLITVLGCSTWSFDHANSLAGDVNQIELFFSTTAPKQPLFGRQTTAFSLPKKTYFMLVHSK
jgi:hypothetical protein